MSGGKTIRIFLPHGEPRGIKIADVATRTVKAIEVPRALISKFKKLNSQNGIGIYFLFGESEEKSRPIVYIGETEDIFARISNHNQTKEFWDQAVVVTSKSNEFTKSHIKYLEWYCYQRCQDIGRFEIANEKIPSKPFIPEPMQVDLEEIFKSIDMLLATLGYPIFEPLTQDNNGESLFFLRSKNSEAKGKLVSDGFVVFAGSTMNKEMGKAARDHVKNKREKLLSDRILESSGNSFMFKQDLIFNSPSAASTVILGSESNGWVAWKNTAGQTLSDIYRSPENN